MTTNKPLNRTLLLGAFVFAVCCSQAALANGSDKKLKADPFVFNAKANNPNQCGDPYPRGANIVTSAWLGGLGLPDDDTNNSQNPFPANAGPSPEDRHTGLLLSKNGPTPECAAAGARIKGWQPGNTIDQLGFDYRNGTHCGGGAPRFNITSTAGFTYFAGCNTGTPAFAPQDPTEWTRVLFDTDAQIFPAGAQPAFQLGVTPVRSISIIYDEGTDTANNDAEGVGLAVIDNINIGGNFITSGRGIEPESDGEGHHR